MIMNIWLKCLIIISLNINKREGRINLTVIGIQKYIRVNKIIILINNVINEISKPFDRPIGPLSGSLIILPNAIEEAQK